MGFWNDVKQEWTWAGIKADWKEHWPDLVAIVVAGVLTPTLQQWLGWGDNGWAFLGVWIVIAVATGVVIGLIRVIVRRKKSFLCVGLDTDLKKIPEHLLKEDDPIFAFNKAIIDATAPYCVAYKPNLAFYEAFGVKGLMAFEKTVKYLKQNYPDQFIIADAKRGDIGNTSQMYARTFFGEYDVDALTVAPYMGEDSVTPFISPLPAPPLGECPKKNHWVILLALTSNKGSFDFQLTEDKQGERLFEKVIRKSQEWGNDENLMYVVGATNAFLLVPGVGAQGGSLEEVCKYGMIADCGLLVNSSRAIIYADKTERFAQVAAEKAKEVALQMAELLNSK